MKRVLIVDDAAFMRFTLKEMLERNGFEVVGEAENGAEGVRSYFECKPDIVTMDVTMPEMSGIEALKAITSRDPKAKVVIVSAMGQKAFIAEAVTNGAKYFIVKPFQEEQVIKIISQVCAV